MTKTPDNTPAPGEGTEREAAILGVVGDLTTDLHPGRAVPVALDSALDRDLGLDSLARAELLVRIEDAFDVTLSEHILARVETPRDLLREVLGAGGSKGPSMPLGSSGIDLGEAEAPPLGASTLVDVLDWHVSAHPDRLHIRLYDDDDDGEAITYSDLHQGAERVAAGLQRHDLRPGEAVIIMLPTGREYFYSFFGILLAGGVPVPIYPPTRLSRLEDHLRRHAGIVENCQAGILITQPDAKRIAGLMSSQAESLRTVATVDELSSGGGVPDRPALGARDTAFLQYTSGSTGRPKGVVLSHANLLANIRALGEAMEVTPADVFVSWLPLYHDMGLIGAWLGSFHYAMPLVIMSPLAFLSRPRRWLWAMHRYRGTLSAAPNFAYELCLRSIKDKDLADLDLASWRLALNGAEAVSPDTLERFGRRFAGCGFRPQALAPVYGLAECSVGLTFPPLGRGPLIDRVKRLEFTTTGRARPAAESDAKALKFVAAGPPLPGHQIRIIDSGGRELPERRQGRLQFTGPSATSGYFRNAAETRRLFDGEWLDSGDLAYIAGGDVYITGRVKDVIIRAGRNIYPEELEEAVGDVPGIRKGNVAVFGTKDAASGTERLVVLAETRKRDPGDREALRLIINGLAQDLIEAPPDEVVLAPPNTVLKTSSGKIRRAASREIYERGLIGKPRRAVWWQMARLALDAQASRLRRARSKIAAGLFAAYAWSLLLALVPPTWLLVWALPGLARRWAVARAAVAILARATGTPLTVRGLENLPSGACVIVSNHASYLDGPLMAAVLPRPVAFVVKAELTDQFVSRVFLGRLGAEFVERFDREKVLDDARKVAGLARAGRSLMFFAEGTVVRMPGLLPFYMGAFVTAAEAGVPVVPIAIRGTRSMLRDDSGFPRPGAITVTIGEPIEGSGENTWASALKLRDAARAYILSHCGEPDLEREGSPLPEPAAKGSEPSTRLGRPPLKRSGPRRRRRGG